MLTSWGFWTGYGDRIDAMVIGASDSMLPVLQKGEKGESIQENHIKTWVFNIA